MTESTPTPSGYAAALAELKQQVRNARFRAQRRANTELVRPYWGNWRHNPATAGGGRAGK